MFNNSNLTLLIVSHRVSWESIRIDRINSIKVGEFKTDCNEGLGETFKVWKRVPSSTYVSNSWIEKVNKTLLEKTEEDHEEMKKALKLKKVKEKK